MASAAIEPSPPSAGSSASKTRTPRSLAPSTCSTSPGASSRGSLARKPTNSWLIRRVSRLGNSGRNVALCPSRLPHHGGNLRKDPELEDEVPDIKLGWDDVKTMQGTKHSVWSGLKRAATSL